MEPKPSTIVTSIITVSTTVTLATKPFSVPVTTNTPTISRTSTITQSIGTFTTTPFSTTKQETTVRPLPDTTTLASKGDDQSSSKETLTIALSTVIPAVFIVAAVGGVLSSAARPFTNIHQHNESSILVKLDQMNTRFTF